MIRTADKPFLVRPGGKFVSRKKLPPGLNLHCSVHPNPAFAYQVLGLPAGIGKAHGLDGLGQRDVLAMKEKTGHHGALPEDGGKQPDFSTSIV
jgi:hypothetical protein